jgi:hypothetical protein
MAYSGNADRQGVEIIGLIAYRQLREMINWVSRDTDIKMYRIRKAVTFLTALPGAEGTMGKNGLQSDPIILCASREKSLEGVTGVSGLDCCSLFIGHE